MKSKGGIREIADYKTFHDAYAGLAAMILVQAAVDVNLLGGKEHRAMNGQNVTKWELLNFFRSDWAAEIAAPLKIDRRQLLRYAEARL